MLDVSRYTKNDNCNELVEVDGTLKNQMRGDTLHIIEQNYLYF